MGCELGKLLGRLLAASFSGSKSFRLGGFEGYAGVLGLGLCGALGLGLRVYDLKILRSGVGIQASNHHAWLA